MQLLCTSCLLQVAAAYLIATKFEWSQNWQVYCAKARFVTYLHLCRGVCCRYTRLEYMQAEDTIQQLLRELVTLKESSLHGKAPTGSVSQSVTKSAASSAKPSKLVKAANSRTSSLPEVTWIRQHFGLAFKSTMHALTKYIMAKP